MNLSKMLYKSLYESIGIRLPRSNRKFSFGAKKIRGFLAKQILSKTGNNINIEKGARFNSSVKIGNNSGIGINCILVLCQEKGQFKHNKSIFC